MLRTRTVGLAGCWPAWPRWHDVRPRDGEKEGFNLIYVPTPQNAVDKMLDMAKVSDKDVVFDLGCGDARIVATAAKNFKAKGVGIDLNPTRIKDSFATLKKFASRRGRRGWSRSAWATPWKAPPSGHGASHGHLCTVGFVMPTRVHNGP